jgi:CBS domain-containing protein
MIMSLKKNMDPGDIDEIMTEGLITVDVEIPISQAYEMMRESGIRHLFVRGANSRVVGIVSDRDVQRAMLPKAGARWDTDFLFEFDPSHRVRDFMTSPVRCVREDCSVQEVALRLLDAKISALLVTGKDGKPRGVVTTDDFLKLVATLPKSSGGVLAEIGALLSPVRPGLGYLL